MEIVSRYRPTADSLDRIRRRFHDVGGEPDSIWKAVAALLAERYGLDGTTVVTMWIPNLVVKIRSGTDSFYFKVVDGNLREIHRYMEFVSGCGVETARVVQTKTGSRAVSFCGRPAYLMQELCGEALSCDSTADVVRAAEILAHLHGRSAGLDVGEVRSIRDIVPELGQFKDLPICVVHGDFKLSHLLKSGATVKLLDCDGVCRMPRIFDVFFFCAAPDQIVTRNLSFTQQKAFFDTYARAAEMQDDERDLEDTLMLLANQYRLNTITEWKRRDLDVSTELENIAQTSLEQARRCVGRT